MYITFSDLCQFMGVITGAIVATIAATTLMININKKK